MISIPEIENIYENMRRKILFLDLDIDTPRRPVSSGDNSSEDREVPGSIPGVFQSSNLRSRAALVALKEEKEPSHKWENNVTVK